MGHFGVPARTWKLPAYRVWTGWGCCESFDEVDETLLRCRSPIVANVTAVAGARRCRKLLSISGCIRTMMSEDLHFSTRRSPDVTHASVKARLAAAAAAAAAAARFAPSALSPGCKLAAFLAQVAHNVGIPLGIYTTNNRTRISRLLISERPADTRS